MKRLTEWFRGRQCCFSFTLVLVLALAPRDAAAQVLYTVTDVGALPPNMADFAFGVNQSGQVTGYTTNNEHTFRSAPNGGSLTDLGTLGGSSSQGQAINATGQVAGFSYQTGDVVQHAFRSAANGSTALTDLGVLGSYTNGSQQSQGFGINASGQVAGWSTTTVNAPHAFRSAPNGSSTLSDLGTLQAGGVSFGYAINDNGQVAGYASVGGTNHIFRSAPSGSTALTDLGDLFGAGTGSEGYAINLNGQVAGASSLGSTGEHAVRSAPNGSIGLTDLGTLGGTVSEGHGIDSNGYVVGFSTTAGSSVDHAFLYDGTSLIDLNSRIDPASGWLLQRAYSITDGGYIAGYGTFNSGGARAFLLTPVPEPTSLAFCGLGSAVLVIVIRRRTSSALKQQGLA
jgi:probable HAF family extracellular repeat protein